MELKPGKYRHFKGKEYRVLGIASHSETLEPMVVYQALYGEGGLWVRPASMWDGKPKVECSMALLSSVSVNEHQRRLSHYLGLP